MNTTNNQAITQIFKDYESAEQAYQSALAQGYSDKDITIIMSEESKENYYGSILTHVNDVNVKQDISVGGAVGASFGGILGALFAVGSNFITPGLGFVVAGPLAGAGAVAGGLMGTLLGLGVSEHKADQYEAAIKSGAIILSINGAVDAQALSEKWYEIADKK